MMTEQEVVDSEFEALVLKITKGSKRAILRELRRQSVMPRIRTSILEPPRVFAWSDEMYRRAQS